MSVSISGQNDRRALLDAYQPTPAPTAGQSGAWDAALGTMAPTGSAATATAAPGGTSGGLSDGMSFALMAFGNAVPAASTLTTGPDSATFDASSADPSAADPQSHLLSDLQSLLSTPTGTSGTADTAGAAAGTQTGPDSPISQQLQIANADLGTIASASGTSHSAGHHAGVQPPPSWGNDISDAGTNSPDGSHWTPGYSDDFRQQFARSAYSATAVSGLDAANGSVLANINV